MIPYQCLSTDHNVGLIEVVRQSNTIANIQKLHNYSATSAFRKGSLLAWIKDHNKTPERYVLTSYKGQNRDLRNSERLSEYGTYRRSNICALDISSL
ncbi:hypothetical protein HPB48_020328 [Haemaphysalis longicornis]|uniref:Uncharacterized protein n=1 Tax=Haemaphysalis longicornis TaxID=44386 RepID=A0A9J6GPK8_HAELO|nr:hypothetical protein HPB48_020328 [Haemaphysalis longicornis]